MSSTHREAIQKQIQQDWANREYIEVITGSIKKITDFLNSFGKIKNNSFIKSNALSLIKKKFKRYFFKNINILN